MNIRFGIYDIFSRIVPGGFYLFAIVELAITLGWMKFDWTILKDANLIISVGLILVAYVIGTAMDRVGSAWHTLFKKRGRSNLILEQFKKRHSDDWVIEFEDKDWMILRTYIYIHNPNVADDIDRNNAICIMLRNLSLGLVILAVSAFIQFVNTQNWVLIALIAFILFLSYQVAIQARTLRDWFYMGIFEAVIAYRLNLEERIRPTKASAKRKK